MLVIDLFFFPQLFSCVELMNKKLQIINIALLEDQKKRVLHYYDVACQLFDFRNQIFFIKNILNLPPLFLCLIFTYNERPWAIFQARNRETNLTHFKNCRIKLPSRNRCLQLNENSSNAHYVRRRNSVIHFIATSVPVRFS